MSADEIDPRPATTQELLRFLDGARSPGANAANGDSRPADEKGPRKYCPPPTAYMEVVLGSCERAEAQALLDHAAVCSACAEALAASLRALEGDPSAEESEALAILASAQPKYQREISHTLAGSRASRRPFLGPVARQRLLWLGAAAAVIAAVATGFWGWQRYIGAPEHLLAQAYQASRTLELRIPKAGYAALHAGKHTRGGAGDIRETPSLLEARAKLEQALESSPEDNHSLELAARADLLEEHYDAAIDKLDRLIAKGSPSVAQLVDGASAYFERGLLTGREVDRTVALDYLRRADMMAPDDPVVLFNEAIVMEDRGQLMNAVAAWTRFATVERDPGWAAEGKSRLAALETVVDRLKSHQSRVTRMLATPEAMVALANDQHRLAQWDEELSSVELDKLVDRAFPGAVEVGAIGTDPIRTGSIENRAGEQSARGSPCMAMCMAARKLLYAVGRSLEQQHHDEWLADIFPSTLFLSPGPERISPVLAMKYARAMRLAADAAGYDQKERGDRGLKMTAEARKLFGELASEKGSANNLLRKAGVAGEWRATAENLFALQRTTDFTGCRAFARDQLGGSDGLERIPRAYPWIGALYGVTTMICDDTPQTRETGAAVGAEALRMASGAHYGLLAARIRQHTNNSSELAGDQERREEQVLGTLRDLMRGDPPPIRVINTLVALLYTENASPQSYALAAWEQEAIGWARIADDPMDEVGMHMWLGLTRVRLGSIDEAQLEFQRARELAVKQGSLGAIQIANNVETRTQLAEAFLERGDVSGAERTLTTGLGINKTAPLEKNSDAWLSNKRAAVTGQLQLEERHYPEAERLLEDEIRQRESGKTSGGDETAADEEQGIIGHDHDLYGELAAVWLAEGRPAADVLALWERFRLRSLGLPVEPCPDWDLACERTALDFERQRLGGNLLTGEIVLMDRVLVYEMDGRGVRWSTRKERRQNALDAVQTLGWAVSSPLTSAATAQSMGRSLAELLLPAWKEQPPGKAVLLLEPDPQLHGLAWPVLPTVYGSLGLRFAISEIASILAPLGSTMGEPESGSLEGRREQGKDGQGRPLVRPLIIGASVSGRDDAPLPEAIEEARQVGEYLNAPDLLVGNQATAQNVAAELSGASVLHFAGHAVQDTGGTRLLLAHGPAAGPGIGVGPGIRPGQDAKQDWHGETHVETRSETRPEARPDMRSDSRPWIDEAFLRTHPPRACRLAVLSACATGGDERGRAVPMRDLVRTLSSLGVPEIVATRWPVDSEASVPFMKSFYSSLESGQDVAHALLAARQSQSRNNLYGNPYFWGAYYVTGRDSISVEEELHASTNSKSSQNRAQERPF